MFNNEQFMRRHKWLRELQKGRITNKTLFYYERRYDRIVRRQPRKESQRPWVGQSGPRPLGPTDAGAVRGSDPPLRREAEPSRTVGDQHGPIHRPPAKGQIPRQRKVQ